MGVCDKPSSVLPLLQTSSSIFGIIMGVPDFVKEKIGEIKDLGALDRDGLAAAVKEYYDLSCATFSERFDIEHQVKKNDMEIHALEGGERYARQVHHPQAQEGSHIPADVWRGISHVGSAMDLAFFGLRRIGHLLSQTIPYFLDQGPRYTKIAMSVEIRLNIRYIYIILNIENIKK